MTLKSYSLPALLLFGVIVLLPIGYMTCAPFFMDTGAGPQVTINLLDTRHLALAQKSLAIGLGTACFSLIIGVSLSFLIHKTDLWGGNVFRAAYLIPILIPPFIHAMIWSHLAPLVQSLFGVNLHNVCGVILVFTLAYFPFVTLLVSSGLKAVDRNLEEISLLQYGRWHTLRHVTIPLIRPHLVAAGALIFIFSVADFGVPDILRVNVYPVEIFIQFSALYHEERAALLSLPLVALTLAVIFLGQWLLKNRSYIVLSNGHSKPLRNHLGLFQLPAFIFSFAVIMLSVVLPISLLVKTSGSYANYFHVVAGSINEIGYSLLLAGFGAFLALLLAFPLSYWMERSNMKRKTPLLFLFLLPLAIPATTLGIGLIKVWNRPFIDWVYGSSFIIVFGYVARFLPFAVVTVNSGLKQLHPNLEEAAFLGTSRTSEVISKIILPLLKPSLLASFFFVFILSLGELGTTLLVIPPGRETIPIKIYNWIHYGAEPMVASLCVTLIGVLLLFSGLFVFSYRRLTTKVAS